jgi:hypothetical protein
MSMTTRETIAQWFKDGKRDGAVKMIIVCDTFDHEDYPVYVMPSEDLRETVKRYDGVNMQRIHEVYDLTLPLDDPAD